MPLEGTGLATLPSEDRVPNLYLISSFQAVNGKVVNVTRLEIVLWVTPYEGSNPSLSAIQVNAGCSSESDEHPALT